MKYVVEATNLKTGHSGLVSNGRGKYGRDGTHKFDTRREANEMAQYWQSQTPSHIGYTTYQSTN